MIMTFLCALNVGQCKTQECKQVIIAQLRLKAKIGDKHCLIAFDGDVLKIAKQSVDKISKKA